MKRNSNKQTNRSIPPPPQATTTPMLHRTHPCYNCPLIRVYGSQLYCYSPRCIRGVMSKALTRK